MDEHLNRILCYASYRKTTIPKLVEHFDLKLTEILLTLLI
jgi:hypothetical protein